MKLGNVIEYNTRNIFFKDHTQNVAEKMFPEPFLKIQNSAYLWMHGIKFQFIFLVSQVEGYQIILKLSSRLLAFASYKIFYKSKMRSGTSLHAWFFAWFLKENISLVYFICRRNLFFWLFLLCVILGSVCIIIVC